MNFRFFITQVCAFIPLNPKLKFMNSYNMIEGSNYGLKASGNDKFTSLDGLEISSSLKANDDWSNNLISKKINEKKIKIAKANRNHREVIAKMIDDHEFKNAADRNNLERVISFYNAFNTSSVEVAEHIMHAAVKNGNLKLLEFALYTGMCSKYEKNIAIGEAVRFGHLELVKLLLDCGAGYKNLKGYLVEVAKIKGFTNIENLIRRSEIVPDLSNYELLIHATKLGHLEIVKKLVNDDGVDVNAVNGWPLVIACNHDHVPVVEFLVSKGANVKLRQSLALAAAGANGNLSLVRYLVRNGANVTDDNDEILASPCGNGHYSVVRYLVDQGLDVKICGVMSLGLASENGHLHIVEYLVENGLNVGHDLAKKIAKRKGHEDIVKYFDSINH